MNQSKGLTYLAEMLGQYEDTFSVNQVLDGGGVGKAGHAWPKTWDADCKCNHIAEGDYYELEITKLKAVIEVYVSPGSGAAAHEAKHVSDYKIAWGHLVEIANTLDGLTTCGGRKCNCYCELLADGRALMRAFGIHLGALLHVNGGEHDGIRISPYSTNPDSMYYKRAQFELMKAALRLRDAQQKYNAKKQFCDQLEDAP